MCKECETLTTKFEHYQLTRRRVQYSDFADGTGNLTIIISVPQGAVWLVDAIILERSGAAAGTAKVYRNQVSPPNLEDIASAVPSALKQEQAIPLDDGDSLLVVFTGLTASTQAHVNVRLRQITARPTDEEEEELEEVYA